MVAGDAEERAAVVLPEGGQLEPGLVQLAVGVLHVAARRALVFSGVTRNSLVVLPLALALPPALALAPLVVVTQTLVELVFMIGMIRVVPRMLPGRTSPPAAA